MRYDIDGKIGPALLPWDTLAFFATIKVGTEIAGQVPIIGKPMMIFLRGGPEVTAPRSPDSLDSMSPFCPGWSPF